MSLPTVADLKKHLGKTTSADDDELVLMLDAAGEVVTSIVGSYDAASVSERVPVVGSTVLLSRVPSGSVTLTDQDGTGLADFTVSAAARVVYDVLTPYASVTATYEVDASATPASVELACLIIAAHLYETQRGAAPSGPLAADDLSLTPGLGFAIPNRAVELLAPYRRPAIA